MGQITTELKNMTFLKTKNSYLLSRTKKDELVQLLQTAFGVTPPLPSFLPHVLLVALIRLFVA